MKYYAYQRQLDATYVIDEVELEDDSVMASGGVKFLIEPDGNQLEPVFDTAEQAWLFIQEGLENDLMDIMRTIIAVREARLKGKMHT